MTVLLTTAMALSMLPLFLLGALGPRLVREFGIAAPQLGLLVAAGFGVAAVLSLIVGPMVAALGARRCLIGMFAVSALALGLFAAAPGYSGLVVAVVVSGAGQALANPATNQLIATRVPVAARGAVAGWKQSGVQFGAFLAGLPLAALAGATNWRVAVAAAATAAAVAAGAALLLTKDPGPPRLPSLIVAQPRGGAGWMCGYSVLLGIGISAINTYVALYASKQLGFPAAAASALVALLGVAGIGGRVGWTRWSSRLRTPAILLGPLAFGAALAALTVLAAVWWSWWVWLGVLGIGCCAVSANAVSMMTVISTAEPAQVGRDSAVVSAGFFAGFVVGPPVFGAIVVASGGSYAPGWAMVAAAFVAAATVAWWWRSRG
ncbi:MFS transporter [Nocardia stercoris]|uniref:MFS transporter n=1 Tax=Nocardia stercoris TaxID=2483361 RepID=A0A3M2KTQ9_9NOCA|nr:MFS transporter [Nocardia stercoris]